MIKSEIKITSSKTKEYPYIGQNKCYVVLFSTHRVGTVVYSFDTQADIGYHATLWNEEEFARITGTITLTQE